MLVYLMRHGIAQDRDDPESPPDPDRQLTRKGAERTAEVARGLRALGVKPGAVLTSPYLRAAQTAAIAETALGSLELEPHKKKRRRAQVRRLERLLERVSAIDLQASQGRRRDLRRVAKAVRRIVTALTEPVE